MTREELEELIRHHAVNHTWCYGCATNVGSQAKHLADLMMPPGVEYLLQAKEID